MDAPGQMTKKANRDWSQGPDNYLCLGISLDGHPLFPTGIRG